MTSDFFALVRAALAEALMLLLPVSCAGCDEPDVVLCEDCADALAPAPRRRVLAADGTVEVWSGFPFEGVAARVMRAVKEEGRTALARSLAPALAAALTAALEAAATPVDSGAVGGVVIVPLPTSRAAYRRRGFRVPDLIARRAGLRVERALRATRRTGDQRRLDRDARRRNVAGSLVAHGVAGRRIVVVDDVVTTGATLAEAVRALRSAGAEVIAAVTVAATPRRRPDAGERDRDVFGTHT